MLELRRPLPPQTIIKRLLRIMDESSNILLLVQRRGARAELLIRIRLTRLSHLGCELHQVFVVLLNLGFFANLAECLRP